MARATLERDGDKIILETGTGIIQELKPGGAGGRNVQVILKATHLNDPVTGWLDTLEHPDAWATANEADLGGFLVEYRIEVRRRTEAPGPEAKAFEDLLPREKLRDMVALTRARGGRSSAEPGGGQNPPASPAPVAPVAPAGPAATAASSPPALAPAPVQGPQRADSPAPASGGGVGESAAGPGTTSRAARDDNNHRGPRLEEAKPWQAVNSDGSLNMGSYAYQAALGMVELAHKLYTDAGNVPSGGQVKALARTLLDVADEAQARIRRDGHHDRGDNSHARARGAVRTALESCPVPWARDEETRAAWRVALVERAVLVLDVARQLAEADLNA